MFIELFCDRDNERGMAFWQKMGFSDIGNSEGNDKYRRFVRWPWPTATNGPSFSSPPLHAD
jgi:hypothetical protein